MAVNALIVGATGLCGSAFLKYATVESGFASVTTITRRKPHNSQAEKVKSIVEKNSASWADMIPNNINVMFSGLATTKGDAGSKENFYKLDHDLNMELAKRAKSLGCETYVLVSSAGADERSHFFYLKTKGEIERDILALGFDKTIILRPGALLGERAESKGFFNSLVANIGGLTYRTGLQGLVGYPVYGDEVGRVGITLALDTSRTEKVQIVESKEILELAAGAD
ncbi:LAMI_0F16556g1_1 [Lachancea mirantina]|uniref:Protein FMP52, mitochondrial n=1 Tax=Lachancea mirantina TaxID=1230905 RepID=A0A1G4K511_9SACH|nr:LAMI_0F16556g1_1 [Lachancea mirantina]